MSTWTIDEIMEAHGGHFFDRDTMWFFRSQISAEVHAASRESGQFFVTSERGPDQARRYTLRRFDPQSRRIDTQGKFGEFGSLSGAHAAARRAALAEAEGQDRS